MMPHVMRVLMVFQVGTFQRHYAVDAVKDGNHHRVADGGNEPAVVRMVRCEHTSLKMNM